MNVQEVEAVMLRDVLKEAAQICKDLDDEALAKEDRLACGAECAAAIADLAVRLNVAGPAASQPVENGQP